MDVSVIIVNYNTVRLLVNAVDSIFKKSAGFSFEIIIVDNNSTDNSQQILNKYYSDKIVYLGLPENVGFGKANNEGIKIARGKNIFFLNPDTALINNAIKILLVYLENNSKVGIVGGNLYTAELKPSYSYCRPLPGILTDELSLLTFGVIKKLIRYPFYNPTSRPITVGGISGADLMIRRETLEEVGYFDSRFFMYYEDTDLNWRVKQAGYKVMSVPEAKTIHLDSQSFDYCETKMRYSLESRAKYLEKTKGKRYRAIADGLLLLAVNMHIFILSIFKKSKNYYIQQKRLIKELYFNNAL